MSYRGENGKYLTKGLFYEFGNKDAPYTLRPDNHVAKTGKEYASAYLIYMNSVDEHDAAMKLVGSKAHWKKLLQCDWFVDGYKFQQGNQLDGLLEWRKDMKARDESSAKKTLLQQVKEGNLAAAKAIIENNKDRRPVGRTNKDKDAVKKPTTSASILKLASNNQ